MLPLYITSKIKVGDRLLMMGKDGGYLPLLLSLSESDMIKNHFLYK